MRIRWSEVDAVFLVEFPDFPGCRTHGATYVAAARNGQQVLELLVDDATA